MSDLISRSALIEEIENASANDSDWWYLGKIEDAPAVDAVPVVRCKDCKHQEDCMKQIEIWKRDHILEENRYIYNKLDFCSYGERRADG